MHVKALGKLKRPAQILNMHIKNRYYSPTCHFSMQVNPDCNLKASDAGFSLKTSCCYFSESAID